MTICALLTLASLHGTAAAEATIGMCYSTNTKVECTAGENREYVERYVRSQCNFWRDPKSPKCHEALTCTERGYFIVRHENTSDSLVARCGVGKESRKDVKAWLEQNCRSAGCRTSSWWIGPWETAEERAAIERKRQEEVERKETARRQEEERKLREEEEKERLAKQEEEKKKREEEARKRQEEERERQEEAHKRQEAEKQRQEDERAKREERHRRDAAERARQAQLAEQERQRRIARGFQDLRAAQDANRKMGHSSAAVSGAVFAMEGGNEGTETTTRALRLGFGFGGKFLPHMSNTTGADVVEESTTDTGGGFAFDGSLEFWPRYMKRYGVGIGAEGGLAGMALPGGGMYGLHAGLGVKGYYGNRARWTIRGELDLAARLIGSSANLFGAIVSGSGSYSLWRLGLGPGFCKTASAAGFCETSFYALFLLDWTSIPENTVGGAGEGRRTGKLVRLGAISKYTPYRVGLELELGLGYPAGGETKYPIESDDADRAGLYFAFSLRKAWSWHSGGASR